jgi:hypothetical protein
MSALYLLRLVSPYLVNLSATQGLCFYDTVSMSMASDSCACKLER